MGGSGKVFIKNTTGDTVNLATSELIETLQELNTRLTVIGSMASSGIPGLRVIGVSMPSTAVTGPITSAQYIAADLTKKIALENMTAVLSNINNAVGA